MSAEFTQNCGTGKTKQIIFLGTGKIIALLCTFALPFFLVRFFTQEQYGLYCQFYTVGQFMAGIFALCLSTNILYFWKNVPKTKIKTLLFNNLLLMLIGGGLASAFLFIPWTGRLLLSNKGLGELCACLAVYVVMEILMTGVEPVYVLEKDNKMAVFYPVFRTVSKALFAFLFILIFKTLTSLFIGIIVCEIFNLAVSFVYVMRKGSRYNGTYSADVNLMKRQLSYSIPYSFANTINVVSDRFDKLLGIALFLPSEYAVYSVAFFAIPGVQQITDSLNSVYVVDITSAMHKNQTGEALSLFHELSGKVFSLTIPAVAGVCIFADSVVTILFSSKYIAATPLFRIHLVAFIFSTFGISLLIRASGQTQKSFYSFLYSTIIMLPLTYFGMKKYGMYGGVVCATFSTILPRVFQACYEMRIVGTNLKKYLPWKRIFSVLMIALIVGIPFLFLHSRLKMNPLFDVFWGGLYLLIVFAIEIKADIFIIDREQLMRKLDAVRAKYF